MSVDKRQLTTDALETLGNIITENEKRDAIHLAVEPIRATQKLYPGQDVGLVAGGAGVTDNPIGIVDPFLKTPVLAGEWFWLVLYPRQITSLRHVWEHPAFEPTTKSLETHQVDSEKWLRDFAAQIDIGYDSLMDAAKTWIDYNDYTVQQGRETWRDRFDNPKEFWHHYEIVTGTKVEDHEATFFCCSC
jgi:hypothetical protein